MELDSLEKLVRGDLEGLGHNEGDWVLGVRFSVVWGLEAWVLVI